MVSKDFLEYVAQRDVLQEVLVADAPVRVEMDVCQGDLWLLFSHSWYFTVPADREALLQDLARSLTA